MLTISRIRQNADLILTSSHEILPVSIECFSGRVGNVVFNQEIAESGNNLVSRRYLSALMRVGESATPGRTIASG